MRYRVEISERIAAIFEVEASSSREVVTRTARRYFDEDILVESGVAPAVTFRVVEE